jgi:hypothetical protein
MKTVGLKSLLALAALATLAIVTGLPARADSSQGHGHRRMVVHGVITEVEASLTGTLLTIDRGEADDDAEDDVSVRLTLETRIVPPGVVAAVDLEAKAVVTPTDEDGVFEALHLVLGARPDKPGQDPTHRPVRACGTIASLPADPADGEWTVSVPDHDDYTFTVNEDTKITPRDATPAVGDAVCFLARHSQGVLVAESIQLRPGGEDDEDDEAHEVVLHGTIKTLPDDLSGEWTLVLEVPGRGDVSVQVNADTEIEGELAVGAKVVVKAEASEDDDGNEVLTALEIKVRARHEGGHDRNAAVRLRGTVTAVSDDGTQWTIDQGDADIVVTVNADTKIKGLGEDESAVGLAVQGVAKRQQDATLLALMLHFKKH